MYTAFCVALEYITGQREYITFGSRTTVDDILTVINEESHEQMCKILGMSFLSNPTKKGLQKQISDWKKHFDA